MPKNHPVHWVVKSIKDSPYIYWISTIVTKLIQGIDSELQIPDDLQISDIDLDSDSKAEPGEGHVGMVWWLGRGEALLQGAPEDHHPHKPQSQAVRHYRRKVSP